MLLLKPKDRWGTKMVSNRNPRRYFGKRCRQAGGAGGRNVQPSSATGAKRKGPRQRFSGNVVCRGTRAAMIRPLIGDEHRWFANKTQRGGRWRSSTISISPRATFPRSAPKSACSSVMLIRFSEPGMKLLAYAASLFFSSI